MARPEDIHLIDARDVPQRAAQCAGTSADQTAIEPIVFLGAVTVCRMG